MLSHREARTVLSNAYRIVMGDSTYTNPQTWTVHMIALQPLP